MDLINFFKLSGSGNDFIIIDNREKIVDETDLPNFIAKICRRKMSVGADGLILVENSDKVDFKWRFYNSDGSKAEMCGNGARCVARFAYLNQIVGSKMSFETEAGIIAAQVTNDRVKINMPEPADLKLDYPIKLKGGPLTISSINTGVPHVIFLVDDIEAADVVKVGREIRYHELFAPAGTNVNFIYAQNDGRLANRTYERGVEDETLACGTGAVAAAIVMAAKFQKKSPLNILTRSGGYLTVHYKEKQGEFYDIYLEGDARIIYKGQLCNDAMLS
ncbi:MAG: diaminopimelate epimerase [Desulfobacterales bacterium]|nr:diaminopimelate epimerase [Desulfobacterales bacterium]